MTQEDHDVNIKVGFWFDNHLVYHRIFRWQGKYKSGCSLSAPVIVIYLGVKVLVLHQMLNAVRDFCRIPAVLILALGLSLPVTAQAAKTVVTDVRVGVQGDATRIVFEVTRQVGFNVFTLKNPYRVVVDLPEVGWRLPPRPLPSATGVFQKLRYGLYKPGNSRVVLDIRTPAAISKAFILNPGGAQGYRLVLDLTPTTHQAFLRDAGKTPLHVAEVHQASNSSPKPGSGPPAQQATSSAPSALAPPAGMTSPSPETAKTQKMVLVKGTGPEQASPFRLAPRKPEPKHRGKKHVVIIDPGHGGVDPGTVGISGIYEKHITLSMARELKRQLQQTGRFKVLLTHDRDIFVQLRDRVRMARDAKAELFISVHADTVRNKSIKGPAVYTLSEKSSDREAQELAEKENKADLIAGVDLTHETPEVTNILIDLAQRESMNQSARFATMMIKQLKRKTKVLRNTHRFAGFAVLKAPDIPSVLLEMGFLSNPQDERALRSSRYRAQLASAVTKAVGDYFVRIEEATLK